MFGLEYLLVEVLLGEYLVDVIRGEVVSEEFVVDGGAHEYDSDLGV